MPKEHTGHSKHPLPTTQEKTLHMDITRWSTLKSDDYILCSQRWRSSIQSARTRLGADCGSDHELLIAKFRLKLKKVGKTTRPFRYDLNQIPYDYTAEVRNRFKGLDLIDRVPDECEIGYLNFLKVLGVLPAYKFYGVALSQCPWPVPHCCFFLSRVLRPNPL